MPLWVIGLIGAAVFTIGMAIVKWLTVWGTDYFGWAFGFGVAGVCLLIALWIEWDEKQHPTGSTSAREVGRRTPPAR